MTACMASVSIRLRAAASAGCRAGPSPRSLRSSPAGTTSAPPRIDRRAVLHMPHRLKFFLAAVEPALQVVRASSSTLSRLSRTSLPAATSSLSLISAVGPEGDFLGEPFVDGGERLVDVRDAAVGDFLEVLGHERGRRRGRRPSAPGRCESRGRRAGPRATGGRRRPAVPGQGAAPSRRTRRCRPGSRG